MGFLAQIFGWLGSGLVKAFGAEVLQPILRSADQKVAAEKDVAMAGLSAEERQNIAIVQAQIENNKLKAADRDRTWLLMWIITLPPAIHSGALYFDSFAWKLPLIGSHTVGSWNVVAPPGVYGELQVKILESFFYVGPALVATGVLGGVAQRWLARR